MNKFAAFLGLACMSAAATAAGPDIHILKGTVTDFEGKPIAGATIEVKDTAFEAAFSTKSDAAGHYSLKVEDGLYESITCIRMEDYGKTNLEFWAWNVPVHADMTLDMRYDKLEVYGVNAFRVQGAQPGTMIYFRPMTFSRYPGYMEKGEPLGPSPEELDLTITVNGKHAKINAVQPVQEFAGDKPPLTAYLVHIERTGAEKPDVDTIHIVAKDKAFGDTGEAYYFWVKPDYRKPAGSSSP